MHLNEVLKLSQTSDWFTCWTAHLLFDINTTHPTSSEIKQFCFQTLLPAQKGYLWIRKRKSGVDPGFPVRGDTDPRGRGGDEGQLTISPKIQQKNCMKLRIFCGGEGGGWLLRSATENQAEHWDPISPESTPVL